jgi:ribosomal protein S13
MLKNRQLKFNKKSKSNTELYRYAFESFYGIGSRSTVILYKQFGLNIRTRLNFIGSKIYASVYKIVNKLTFKDNLKNTIIENRKFVLEQLKNYKSIRHFFRYPARGQRTHTNAKTRKNLKNNSISNLT